MAPTDRAAEDKKTEPHNSWVRFDGMTWPNPLDPNEVESVLRYGTPTREQILTAASFMAAYRALVYETQEKRNQKCRKIRQIAEGR